MTKEDIEKEAERYTESFRLKAQTKSWYLEKKTDFIAGALFASSQERETAVAFALWIDENNYVKHRDFDEWQMLNPTPPSGKQNDEDDDAWEALIGDKYTTAELYELFKNNTEK